MGPPLPPPGPLLLSFQNWGPAWRVCVLCVGGGLLVPMGEAGREQSLGKARSCAAEAHLAAGDSARLSAGNADSLSAAGTI